MSGVSTRTRPESLQALLAQTRQEISIAVRRGHPIADLRDLEARLEAAIASGATSLPRSAPNRVDVMLEQLHVTAHDVKTWALAQGLVEHRKRGRVGFDLVEAYAAAHRGRAELIAEHGAGRCAECGVAMIKAQRWQDGNVEERHLWKSWGLARGGSRGICARCRERLTRHGGLERHTVTRTAAGDETCNRCGMKGIAADLCVDCRDFLTTDPLAQDVAS